MNDGVIGDKLDNVIDNLTDKELIQLLENENGYTRSFAESLSKLSDADKKHDY